MNYPARRVLRLATTARPRRDRDRELARLFGDPVDIHVEVTEHNPSALAVIVAEIDALAVLADVYRGDLDELRRAVAPVPVLRPVLVRRPGMHAGLPSDQFDRYQLLGPNGELIELADGALA